MVQIDVEGCELEVLQGVQPKDWARIKQVCSIHQANDACMHRLGF